MTAADSQLLYDAGAFPGSPASGGAACVYGCYDIPNARVEGLDVVTNRPKVAAYRAPGVPAATFGFEQVLDEICKKLNMDPLEFRLLNASKEGTRQVTGPQVLAGSGAWRPSRAAKDHDHYSTPLEGPNRGRGVAGGFWRKQHRRLQRHGRRQRRRYREPRGGLGGHRGQPGRGRPTVRRGAGHPR